MRKKERERERLRKSENVRRRERVRKSKDGAYPSGAPFRLFVLI